MVTKSRLIFWAACAAMLVLACFATGCTSAQAPVTPTATTAGTQPASPAGSDAIAIKNFAFSPSTLTVTPGTTIVWTNQDSTPHQVVSDAGSPVAFSSETLAKDSSFRFSFTQAGTYTYHCSIHPSMTGTIIVQS